MTRVSVTFGAWVLILWANPTGTLAQDTTTAMHAERLAPWADYVAEAAQKTGLPPQWINAVILAESGGRATLNDRPITSSKGAMGLMQLMPATYASLKSALNLGSDPYDPHDNILAGATYLRAMFDRYGYPGLFAAYNCGPGRFDASLRGEKLPAETRLYLAELTQSRAEIRSGLAIFVGQTSPSAQPVAPDKSALFVMLRTPNADEN